MTNVITDKGRIKRKYGMIDTANPSDFKPWIRTRDMKSGNGRRHIIFNEHIGRQIHLLSNLEKEVYQMFIDSKNVIQLYEQVPLVLSDTLSICKEYGLHHPINPNTYEYNVMTTDFVIIVQKDRCKEVKAYAVKMSEELNDSRTLEKLKIEECYWKKKGISWCVITEEDL